MLWIPWMKCVCVCFNSMFSNEKENKKKTNIMQKRNVCPLVSFSLFLLVFCIFSLYFFFSLFCFGSVRYDTYCTHTIFIDFGKRHTHAHPYRAVAILLHNNHETCFPSDRNNKKRLFFEESTVCRKQSVCLSFLQ